MSARALDRWRDRVAAGLSLPDRWAYVVAALLLATLAARAAYGLAQSPQAYPDLVVGNLAWAGAAKQPDFAVLFGFLGGFVVGLALWWGLAGWVLERRGSAAAASLHHLLVMASLPGWIWLGGIVLKGLGELDFVLLGGVFTGLTVVVAMLAIGRREEIAPDDLRAAVAASVVIVVLAALTPVALAFVPGRAGPWLGWVVVDARAWTTTPALAGAAALALAFVAAVWSPWSATADEVQRRLRTALRLVQAPMLLFFLTIIPVPWTGNERLATSTRPSAQLWLVVALLVVVGLVDLWRRAGPGRDGWFGASLSPVVAVALLALFKTPDIGQATVPLDDFHFGEIVTPFWAWFEHGLTPYWDYAPARGFPNYSFGLLSVMLFDGSAASLGATVPVAGVIYWAVALPVLRRVLGVPGALVALLLMAPVNWLSEIDILVTAGLVILVQAYLAYPPGLWLGVWALVGTTAVLLAPGQGGLLVLATTPLGGAALAAAWHADRRRLGWMTLAVGGVALVVLVTTPVGQMLAGAVRYGTEQVELNAAGNGIAWIMNDGGWLYEGVRFAWIAVGLGAGALVLAGCATRALEERRKILSWAGPIFLLCAFYVVRAAGRVDSGSVSRPGLASIWALALLAPLLVALVRPEPRRDVMVVAAVFAASLLAPSFGPLRLAVLWQRPFATVTPDPSAVVGAEHGLPAIGTGRMSQEHLTRLIGVKKMLDRVLEPGETYLDVTNRGAQYFYFNLPPPIEVGAFYNLIHRNQHLRAIRRLADRPPPIAVVGADNILHDGGTVATRAYPLFRYLIQHYEPAEVDGRVFLLRPDRVGRIMTHGERTGAGSTETQLGLLDRVFLVSDLKGIPRAWGASFAHLERHVREVAPISFGPGRDVALADRNSFAVTGPTPTLTASVASLGIGGAAAGLLRFSVKCLDGAPGSRFAVGWAGDQDRGSGRITFDGDGRRKTEFLLPLDAQPRWLRTTHIDRLAVELSDPQGCRRFRLVQSRFYQRRVVDAMRSITD